MILRIQHSLPLAKNRSNSFAVMSTPSMLAHDFLQSTCSSGSGYDSDVSDTTSGSTCTTASLDDEDTVLPLRRRKIKKRQMTIYPSSPPPPPSSPHKVQTTPTKHVLLKANTIQVDISPSHHTLRADPTQSLETKSLLPYPLSPHRKKRIANTLGPRLLPFQSGTKKRVSSSYYEDLVFSPYHIISSPIPIPSDTSSISSGESPGTDDVATSDTSPNYLLRRVNAMKRKSLHDLGVRQLLYDVS